MFGRIFVGVTRRQPDDHVRFVKRVGLCLALALFTTSGQLAAETVAPSSTTRQARDEAARAIPFDRMTPEMQRRLQPIVSDPSLYRRLPLETIDCEPDLYLLMVRYPEIVVNIWHLMDITNVTIDRTGDYTLQADDGAGTKTQLELIYGTRDLHVLYSRGLYDGPLFRRPIQGDCVLLLRSDYQPDAEGRMRITSQLDVFLKVDHTGAQVLARTLQPLLGRTADENFVESIGFLSRINKAAEQHPRGIQGLATRLEDVDPEVRESFSVLAARVAENIEARRLEQGGTRAVPASLGSVSP